MNIKTKAAIPFLLTLILIVFVGIDANAQWNGIIPNVTTRTEVFSLLGEPSVDSSTLIVYEGDKAPADTRGIALFFVNDIVVMIRVIPGKDMTEGEISGTYGKPVNISTSPQAERFVFETPAGRIEVIFSKKSNKAIRIDYL